MNPDIESTISAFAGSAALTSLFVILALIGTLNPYHRPAIPMLGASTVIFASTYLFAQTVGIPVDSVALRLMMTEGVLALLDIFPLVFLVCTFMFLQASLRKRPEDPLLALLKSKPGSE
jgi:hypothetical protein